MSARETWLLPDGVADVLPQKASQIESLRRLLLDTVAQRGYQLIMTPLVEFVESLLIHNNHDLDLITCKITDQLTGRQMGVRADITPQVARIDAHVAPTTSVARYCYASSVLHAKMGALTASRVPLQFGVELFGSVSVEADIEVISTALDVLKVAGIEQGVVLDIAHVGVFNALCQLAELDADDQKALRDCLRRKAFSELPELLKNLQSPYLISDFMVLARHADDLVALKNSLSQSALTHAVIQTALSDLQKTVSYFNIIYPNVSISIDCSDIPNYQYHTGLVFAIYMPRKASPIVKGGRYDGIGYAFGKARPATGFSLDVHELLISCDVPATNVVYAPLGADASLQQAIDALRSSGTRVIQALPEEIDSFNTNIVQQLQLIDGQWQVA